MDTNFITMCLTVEDLSKVEEIQEIILNGKFIQQWDEYKENKYYVELSGDTKEMNKLYERIIVINRRNSFWFRIWYDLNNIMNIVKFW